MATRIEALPNIAARETNPGIIVPALSLWQREIVRFYRNRSRVIGVIASPLLFWIVIGSGFGSSFSAGGSRTAELSPVFLYWRAHHDCALHGHLHDDVGD